ncbi:PKD domain-containing protein [Neobacillus sp. 179-C4.2 HS]|uniref:PKD domain-containing protein n=1 Tax=Neobacillus driksii TaxID=3035913 RepID=A0ABV4YP18_9BACI|nr:PKD domain-containing protein [Neobacillus sp. 179.-C4.2 HS]MDP5197162.1 PKD domain-containing protein [Neobacillus sp. 179.-C4.2 HS]
MKLIQKLFLLFTTAALFAMTTLPVAGEAQGPEIEWEKIYGGDISDVGFSVQQTKDGGYITAGLTNSYGAGSFDVYLIKTDKFGRLEWEKTFGGTSYDTAMSVQQTTDGGYIIGGHTESFGVGKYDFYLIKTDDAGNKQWEKTFGGNENDIGYSVKQTKDGGYVISGFTNSYGKGSYDVYLIKTDKNGNIQWEKTYGGTNDDISHAVQQTKDGGYVLTGITNSFGTGDYDVYFIKTDEFGNTQWEKIFGGSSYDEAYSVQQTTDGGYIISGQTDSYGAGYNDFYLIKTDETGNIQWEKTYGGNYPDFAQAVQQTTDGGYIMTGSTGSFGLYGNNVYIVKTDGDGNLQWEKITEGNSGYGYSIQQTTDGGYVIAGYASDSVYLTKLAPETISNLPPVITVNNQDVMILEGQTASNTGTWSDADVDDTVNLTTAPGTVTQNPNGTWYWSFNTTDDLNQPVAITADDGTVSANTSFNLIVKNVAPKVDPISVPLDPVPVNTSITASASFTDPGILDTHNAVWNWGDGTTTSGTLSESNGSGSVSNQHSYATPGIYKVQLKVTDDDGDSSSVLAEHYVVVYDPGAGFVTGGGWINSPGGAFTADPSMTGKANFGFVSKYKKGATTPEGQTEFQFKAGNLNFHSSSYDWLVIAGAKAQYKGKGTINGAGDYGFMLSAVDGKLSGDGKDKFRIKIWNRTTNEVVYDNQIGAVDDANPTTAIESGSIVIHK